MPIIKHILLGLVLAGMLLPGHVLADRAPTPQERSRIETMLRAEGFTRAPRRRATGIRIHDFAGGLNKTLRQKG